MDPNLHHWRVIACSFDQPALFQLREEIGWLSPPLPAAESADVRDAALDLFRAGLIGVIEFEDPTGDRRLSDSEALAVLQDIRNYAAGPGRRFEIYPTPAGEESIRTTFAQFANQSNDDS